MTRIETALRRMRDEAQVMVWHGDLTKALATPTGQALAALVEAAGQMQEHYIDEEQNHPDDDGCGHRFDAAWDAFRAATEPRP